MHIHIYFYRGLVTSWTSNGLGAQRAPKSSWGSNTQYGSFKGVGPLNGGPHPRALRSQDLSIWGHIPCTPPCMERGVERPWPLHATSCHHPTPCRTQYMGSWYGTTCFVDLQVLRALTQPLDRTPSGHGGVQGVWRSSDPLGRGGEAQTPQGLGPPEVPSGAGLPGTRPLEAWARKGTDFDPVLLPRARARYVSRSTFGPSGVQIWTRSYRPNSVISGSSNGPPYFTPF